ncbi:MAG: ribonuclease HI family protein [Thermomicrobiales bacterium]
METYQIIFDGGSLGNPGLGYGSFAVSGPDGYETRESLEFQDRGSAVTNNESEYLTLIAALDRLVFELGPRARHVHVEIGGDSQLVIYQVTGAWKVRKAELRPLHDAVHERLRHFGSANLSWHPRARTVEVLGH